MKRPSLVVIPLAALALLPPACGKKSNADPADKNPPPRAVVVGSGEDSSTAPTGKDVLDDVSKAAKTTKDYLRDKAKETGGVIRETAGEVSAKIKEGAVDIAERAGRMRGRADETWRESRDWMKQSYERTAAWGHEKKTEAVAAWEELLVRSDQEIDRLKALAADAGEAGAEKYRESIAALEKRKHVTEEKLAALSQASSENWNELKDHLRQAASDLHKAYSDARNNIEGEE